MLAGLYHVDSYCIPQSSLEKIKEFHGIPERTLPCDVQGGAGPPFLVTWQMKVLATVNGMVSPSNF